MLKSEIHTSNSPLVAIFHKPFLSNDVVSFPLISGGRKKFSGQNKSIGINGGSINVIQASFFTSKKTSTSSISTNVTVTGVVTVQKTLRGIADSYNAGVIAEMKDSVTDLLGKSISLEFVAAELDPKTRKESRIQAYAHRTIFSKEALEVEYKFELEIPRNFGTLGGMEVENEHHTEMYLKNIVLDGFIGGRVNVPCNSWVQSKFDGRTDYKRFFFTATKSYIPSKTPSALKKYREIELKKLQGNGVGVREIWDRIYDYDVYNDLGDPDADPAKARPILGGNLQFPYPRRCRTGRPRTKKDPFSESRSSYVYVPSDEAFSGVKYTTYSAKAMYSILHKQILPAIKDVFQVASKEEFSSFTDINILFNQGIELPVKHKDEDGNAILPRLIKDVADATKSVLLFETPELLDRDAFSWIRNEEFSRQTLAGMNPCSIRLVKEWPLKSKLNPDEYGPPESAITTELIEQEIGGFMSVKEAIKQNKLFILDYHDLLLPYVKKVRELPDTTLYGSRTLFFLAPDCTLMPLAIELTRPPMDGKPQWKEVYRPSWTATGAWLWKLARIHVLVHDSGYHQLVSHWLRTHYSAEPYVIASHRQLSAVHPIFRLLHPHFRYTLEINALARESLISADGTIESTFFPGKYSMELSSVAYDLEWQFNLQALPADLIHRGMAVEDPTAPHGLKLAIKDYPFTN